MAIDPARASLVVQEYRYAEAPDISASAAIRAAFDLAPVIEIDTNLDATGGAALAAEIAQAASKFVRTFSVRIEDALYPEDFTDGAPRYTLAFDRHASVGLSPYSVVAAKIDFFNDRSTLTVRGS